METNLHPTGELKKKGQLLIEAAYEYWKEYRKVGRGCAVVWLKDTSGHVVIFTRGEYTQHLMKNIDGLWDEEELTFPFEEKD